MLLNVPPFLSRFSLAPLVGRCVWDGDDGGISMGLQELSFFFFFPISFPFLSFQFDWLDGLLSLSMYSFFLAGRALLIIFILILMSMLVPAQRPPSTR